MSEECTWSVVVTALAPPVIVKSFVAHHLRLGASEIFIFFDDPSDPMFDLVAGIPRVRAVRCDAAHWKSACGARPRAHQERQIVNVGEAKRSTSATWIAHIDIDEFLFPHTTVEASLAKAPASADAVRLNVAENAYRKFPRSYADALQGPFKRALPRGSDGDIAAMLLYGDAGGLLTSGLQGHHQGKLFARAAAKCDLFTKSAVYLEPRRLPAHFTNKKLADKARWRVLPFQQDDTLVLHFFSVSHRDWCTKYLRRLDPARGATWMDDSGTPRWAAFRDAAEHSAASLSGMFQKFNILSERQAATLQTLGALVDARLDVNGSVEAVFGRGDHGFDELLPDMPYDEIRETLAGYARPGATASP